MSVTVVSTAVATIAKPPAAAEHSPGKLARDDGADASQGFAGVLSGQLAPTPPATLVGENSRPASSADVEPELPADNAAAGLMAALGLVPASGIQVRSTAPASPPLPTATTLASLAPAQAAGAASAGLPDSAAALDTASDRLAMAQSAHSAHSGRFTDAGNDALAGKADAAIAAKAMSDDKSAIIAAASLPRTASTTETPATRSVALEAVYGALPPPTPREAALAVTTPVRDAGWAAEVADKIVWLAANDRQSAKLTLNPAHLGPLEISLHIDKGHATAAFVSASAEVR
ncbi:MAG: flagellar hook-length control protein FliK, partial [Propionivibrio sp.]